MECISAGGTCSCPSGQRLSAGVCRTPYILHDVSSPLECASPSARFHIEAVYYGPDALACQEAHINNPNRLDSHSSCAAASSFVPLISASDWHYDAGQDIWSMDLVLAGSYVVPNGYDTPGISATASERWYYATFFMTGDRQLSGSARDVVQNEAGDPNACVGCPTGLTRIGAACQ